MTPINAMILGIVQGLTEFLPVSSSGHLVLVPRVFGWQEQPLAFDVALHAGTLLALAIYFGRDWWVLIRETLADIGRVGPRVHDWGPYGHLALLIAVATVPAVLAGLAAGGIEDRLRTPGVVAAMLVLVGIAMAAAERWSSAGDTAGAVRVTVMQAGLVGVAQSFALIPGVSRSGSTIAAGMATGLSRATAARFSFLLAMPITLAAALKEVPGLRGPPEVGGVEIAIGVGASFICGLLAIAFLLRYVAQHRLYIFVWYRVVLAAVVLVML